MHRSLLLLAFVCFTASAAMAQDPVKVDPKHYKVIFENDQVRVLQIHYGPQQDPRFAMDSRRSSTALESHRQTRGRGPRRIEDEAHSLIFHRMSFTGCSTPSRRNRTRSNLISEQHWLHRPDRLVD